MELADLGILPWCGRASSVEAVVAQNLLVKHGGFKWNSFEARVITSIVESLALLYVSYTRAPTRAGKTAAVLSFWKHMVAPTTTITHTTVDVSAAIMGDERFAKLQRLVEMAFGGVESQGFSENLDSAHGLFAEFKDLRRSEGVAKLQKFMLYGMSLGLFEAAGLPLNAIGYSRMEAAALKRKYKFNGDFVECAVDTLLWIVNAGFQIYSGKKFRNVVHSGAAYSKFMEDVEQFAADLALYSEHGIATGLEYNQFFCRLAELEGRFQEIWEFKRTFSYAEKKNFQRIDNQLRGFRAQMLSEKICQAPRKAPFSILLEGPASIGKSNIIELLYSVYGKRYELPIEPQYKYTASPVAKYWDGFHPKMWCLVMDDLACKNPKADGTDPSVESVIQVVNNVPFMPDQASLEKKGNTPFLGRLVIATTNTLNLNAPSYMSYPSALLRRFPYVVRMTVKDEFRGKGNALDVPLQAGPPQHDYWHFDIQRVVPVGRKVEYVSVLRTDSVSGLVNFFYDALAKFDDAQSDVNETVEFFHGLDVCEECKRVTIACACGAIADEPPPYVGAVVCPTCSALLSECQCDEDVCRRCFSKLTECSCPTKPQSLTAIVGGMGWFLTFFFFWGTDTVGQALYDITMFFFFRPRHPITDFFVWHVLRRVVGVHMLAHRAGAVVEREAFRRPKLFVAIAAFLGIAGVMVMLRKTVMEAQAMKVPVPMEQEAQRYYYAGEERPVTKFPTSEVSRCLTMDELTTKVEHNVVYCEFRWLDKQDGSRNLMSNTCRLLGLGGTYYLTNAHSVPPSDSFFYDVVSGARGGGVRSGIRGSLTQANVVTKDSDKDLIILHMPSMPCKSRIIEYFPAQEPSGFAEGCYVDRDDKGLLKRIPVPRIEYKTFESELGSLRCAASVLPNPTRSGQCGMPLVAKVGAARAVLGIHAVGNPLTGVAGASLVTQPWLKEALSGKVVVSQSQPVLSAPGFSRSLRPLDRKSVFRHVVGSGDVHGSFVGFRPAPRSRVRPSMFAEMLAPRGIATDFQAPVMKGWRPWAIAAKDMCAPVVDLRLDVLQRCADAYLADVRQCVPDGAVRKMVHPIPLKTNLNGQPGVTYMDGIKRNTSAGAPFCHSKRHHLLPDDPCAVWQDPVRVDTLVLDRMQLIEARYARGELFHPVFTGHLKDEPVSAAKAASGKTRVFCGAPFDWSLVVRKFFMGHVRLIQNYRFAFECGVGLVATSEQWSDVYERLTVHGTNKIVAGDYKAYDKRMSPDMILTCFGILIELAQESGNFSVEEIESLWCVAHDTAYPSCEFNGDFVTFWGSNPSGHPLTVIINSLANSLYMRYAYEQSGYDVATFAQNVSLLTYGDDNIMGVSDEVPDFHHTSIQRSLGGVGVTYTMADKEAESVPYISIADASFLKRSWLFDCDHEVWLAPLEVESIHKMLCVIVESKSVSEGEQMSEIVRSAHGEWFHHGSEEFRAKTSLLREVIAHHGLDQWFAQPHQLLTEEQMWERFRSNSEKNQMRLD
jgi:hypothetical protein